MMNIQRKPWLIAILIVYITTLFFIAVLNRDAEKVRTVYRLDLFWGYSNPNDDILKDNILNIASFIPIGILVALIAQKYRIIKALVVGLLFSLTIEFSQLIFEKGTFDVDDLFNNTVGAVIGELFVGTAISIKQKLEQNKHIT